MGKRLTLLPECRECTSACPNKPQKEKCSMNKHCLTKDARTNLGAAHTWLSAARGGQSDTWGDGENQSCGGGCSPSCTSDQSATGKVPSGSTASPVEALDGGASSTAPAHLPSVSPQVVPHPSKTHRDALAPLEKLSLIWSRFSICIVLYLYFLGWLGPGTKPYTLQPFLHTSSWRRQELEISLALHYFCLWKCKPPTSTIFWGWQLPNTQGMALYCWLAGIVQKGL